tara:strand:- start:1000 stop:1410 length:411 start_codon:yes stop_codon:yes gene_type:complete
MAMFVGGVQVTGTQTLDATKLTGNLPALSGASLTALTAANITASGTLPALNGSNLTSLPSASTIPLMAAGSVSSIGNIMNNTNTRYGNGSTISGGNVYFTGTSGTSAQSAGGTWRINGYIMGDASGARGSVCQRIS